MRCKRLFDIDNGRLNGIRTNDYDEKTSRPSLQSGH